MRKIKKITALLLIAFMIVGVLPVAQLGQGQGVQAATADEIVKDAASWINYTKYVLGGTDLEKGCDCSGFVCAIFKRHGLDLVRDYGLRDCEDFVRGVSKYGKIVGNTPGPIGRPIIYQPIKISNHVTLIITKYGRK